MTTVRDELRQRKVHRVAVHIQDARQRRAPNIAPIETYISSAARQSAAIIPFRSRRKARASALPPPRAVLSRFCAFICRAPKPAFSILPIICSGVTSPRRILSPSGSS